MSEITSAARSRVPASGTESAREASVRARLRVWLGPFLVLFAAAMVVLFLGELLDQGRGLITALRSPDAEQGAQALGNMGQVVAEVLGVAISVVAIIVELAANRYTHRITELFFRATTNFVVMGLFVVSALQCLWVSFTYSAGREVSGSVARVGVNAPAVSTALSVVLMSVSMLLLLPYFAYVAAFVNPLNILQRIRSETLKIVTRGPKSESPDDCEHAQHAAADGAEQLADVALNAMVNHDKGISMAAVNAVGDLLRDYVDVKGDLPKVWFVLSDEVRGNPDFVSLAEEALGEIEKDRTWFEFKLLRQYETIYRAALNNYRELDYLIAINTRELAELAMSRGDKRVLDLAIKFFNTFLRATINARDVRTAYNVLNQYRLLAEAALRAGHGRVAVAIAKYFKYYGQLAFNMDLGFVLETAAYDLCSLNELAFDLNAKDRPELLRVFLQVDKEGEGAKREAALRGVRKAQVKLACYYLLRGDASAAREVYRDMANEQPSRLASIRDELLAVESPYFWEVTDRGTNFDWMPPERRARVMEFFEWFGDQLPTPRASIVPVLPEMPLPIHASATGRVSALSEVHAEGLIAGAVKSSIPPLASSQHAALAEGPSSSRSAVTPEEFPAASVASIAAGEGKGPKRD